MSIPRCHHTGPLLNASRRGAGLGWLITALAVIGVASVLFLAPDLPRRILGTSPRPTDRGLEPEAKRPLVNAPKQDPTDNKANKQNDGANKTEPKDNTTQAQNSNSNKTDIQTAKTYADEAKAAIVLNDARTAYRAFQWTKASSTAMRITSMDVSPATKQRAKDVIHGASALEKLFASLDDKDELSRDFDTHPCLVEVTYKGSSSRMVPLVTLDPQVEVDKDPVGAIEKQRRTGKVTLLMKGFNKYSPVTLESDYIEQVKPIDVKVIIAQMRQVFDTRHERVSKGPEAKQALSWYELGRFAYRNRLDDKVTDMMDKSLELDPALVATVREDRAAVLLGHMLVHLKSGNRTSAATWLAIIRRRFADTDSGKQAQAYYAGETEKLIAMAREAEKNRVEAEARRREQRIARANALGDAQAAKQIKDEPTEPVDEPVAAVNGDEVVANNLVEEGRKLCGQAMKAENGPGRNRLYDDALKPLRKAKAMYSDLVKKFPGNQNLQVKLMECQRFIYLALKGHVAG